NSNGTFTYTPAAGFGGDAVFQYIVKDSFGTAGATNGTVSLHVVAPPTAVNDQYQTDEDQPLTVDTAAGAGQLGPGVLINDTDTEGSALTAVVVTLPKHGTLVSGGNTLKVGDTFDGTFVYSP